MPQIKLSLPTLAFFLSFVIFEPSFYSALPLLAALLHECGHLLVLLALKRKIQAITVLPFGVEITCAPALSSYGCDLAVALAGVFANFLAVLFCMPHLEHTGAAVFAAANLLLLCLNLLPIATLDGGVALHTLLLLFCAPARAEKIASVISFCALVLLWLVACDYLLLTGYHFSLFCMAIFLFSSLYLPQRKTKNREE